VALLGVEDLSIRFGGLAALSAVSFEAAEGEILALIGPNGAGKSTLFNCISGFLRPDDGRIELAGRRIDRRPPHLIVRAGLGRTFQTARALTRMTVLDNVRLAAPAHPGESLLSLVGRHRAVFGSSASTGTPTLSRERSPVDNASCSTLPGS
jgi:ABC-type branched-subunit amino acid transport system ATPase component